MPVECDSSSINHWQRFRRDNLITRNGGDEFIAICKNINEIDLNAAFSELESLQQEKSAGRPHKVISAYGYANNKEKEDNDPEKDMKIANDRMYQMKARYYESTNIERRKGSSQQIF